MASGRGLGSLTLDLILKLGGFEAGWDKAARITDKRAREIEKRANALGRGIGSALKSAAGGLLAFAGVSVGVASAVDSIKSAIDRADNIRDLSIRLGIGTEQLSKFGYAATQTGTDIEALNKGLLRLSKNANAALDQKSRQAGLFEALGISKQQLRDLDTLVPAIADKFKGMSDGVQKAALAQELFGKSGAQLIEFLNQGSAGLKQMGDRAEELGIVIDQHTADAADRFNDKVMDLKAAMNGLATQVASALLPQLEKIVDWATAFVSNGDNAKEIADGLTESMQDLAQVMNSIGQIGDFLGAARKGMADLELHARESSFSLANLYRMARGLPSLTEERQGKQAKDAVDAAIDFSRNRSKPSFKGVYSSSSSTEADFGQNAALDKFFATGGRTPKSGGGRKGKNEAAEALKEQARQAKEAREELERLVKQEAEARDSFEAMAASLAGPLADANFQFIKDQERLNELAKQGAIGTDELAAAQENLRIAHEKNVEAINAQLTPSQEVIAGLREEIELIGLSDIAQQKLIATKQAGKEATEEEIAEIERLIEAREQANKAADLQREVEAGLADAIYDVATGAKSAGDAVKDFFDELAKYITRMIAENWAKRIAEMFNSSGSGSGSGGGGTNWFAAIASIFASGSGKAGGGTVAANTLYPVNERGAEMLTVGGKDYLMMGSHAGRITPNHSISGTAYAPTYNFNYQAPYDESTESQKNARIGYEAQRAMARNRR